MYQISLATRFTYPKTASFWNNLKTILLSYASDSTDYFAIKRDTALFLLCYSYGLRLSEAICLHINNLNFYERENDDESFGSIFLDYDNSPRLIYPIFPETTKEIESYFELRRALPNTIPNSSLFITTNEKTITPHYINKRLQYYNSKIASSNRVTSIYTFRQYYIADLLRIKGLSQSFINRQIGNNIINNQIYSHLLPSSN